jgi:predicted permease
MTLTSDLRLSARSLIRQPWLAVTSVVALALGIGLTTTMFSIVDGCCMRGLPFVESERLVAIRRVQQAQAVTLLGINRATVPIHDYVDWRDGQNVFEGLAAFTTGTINLSGSEGRPERYSGAFMTANTFRMLRVEPVLGRTFGPEEEHPGAPPVLVLGYAVWQDRFGSDPSIIGRQIRANSRPATIVGVMPAGFAFPVSAAVWLPLTVDPHATPRGRGAMHQVFGRLRTDVSLAQATSELEVIAGRLAKEHPDANGDTRVRLQTYFDAEMAGGFTNALMAMLGAVFGVLLIACANVANLLLARAATRTKEFAIRSALGASRRRLIAFMTAEASVLALGGGLLGLGIGWAGIVAFLNATSDIPRPFWIVIQLDAMAVACSVGLTLVAAVVSGVVPAVQASRPDVNDVLKDESRGSSSLRLGRFSKGLVIAEVALSCGLLVGAGLMIKSVRTLDAVDFGFPVEQVLTARVGPVADDSPQVKRARFYEELERRLAAKPGVQTVGLTSNLPAMGSEAIRFEAEGVPYSSSRDYPSANWAQVSPGFFETFNIRPLEGRVFNVSDNSDEMRVAVVNRSFAERYFRGRTALGQRIRTRLPEHRPGSTDTPDFPWLTIVGVVPDRYLGALGDTVKNPPGFYVPIAQRPARFASVAIRSDRPPIGLTPIVRDEVASMDPDLPAYNAYDMAQVLRFGSWFYGTFGGLFVIFGAVALLLAAIGLYAIMAFSVNRRTQEFGIRMALGASARDVRLLVLRQGGVQVATGLVLGLALAGALTPTFAALLFNVEPWDPFIFAGIATVLALVGATACLLPARRAVRVDPLIALRHE